MQAVAINISPQYYSLDQWQSYWRDIPAGDVLWAQDNGGAATSAYQLTALGTTVIIDREGKVRYRDEGVTSYEKYKEELAKVL